MQSGQIIAGILTLVGAIVGHVLSTWRDGRRWNRELRREDLRWKRELEKDFAARATESDMYWRERRFDAYRELFTVLTTCGDAIKKGAKLLEEGKEIDRLTEKRLADYLEMYEKHFHMVVLYVARDQIRS